MKIYRRTLQHCLLRGWNPLNRKKLSEILIYEVKDLMTLNIKLTLKSQCMIKEWCIFIKTSQERSVYFYKKFPFQFCCSPHLICLKCRFESFELGVMCEY